jgi:pro-apoptotic serine protease NMA111
VDAKRGILLTNRHVVTPGPIKAEAVFHNREECPVHPLYYDPVRLFDSLNSAIKEVRGQEKVNKG